MSQAATCSAGCRHMRRWLDRTTTRSVRQTRRRRYRHCRSTSRLQRGSPVPCPALSHSGTSTRPGFAGPFLCYCWCQALRSLWRDHGQGCEASNPTASAQRIMTAHQRNVSASIDPVKLDRLAEVAIKVGLQLAAGAGSAADRARRWRCRWCGGSPSMPTRPAPAW